jgi:hypothetical protein
MKIKGKITLIKKLVWLIGILLLFYTRLINLSWGLPYPMHPDERNMADALKTLYCPLPPNFNFLNQCFHPHFFAYGQLPLYLGYLLIFIKKFLLGEIGLFTFGKISIHFSEAILALRFISAIASIFTAIIIFRIYKALNLKTEFYRSFLTFLIIVFSPVVIQFSHFGTTESLLMLFYTLIVYLSLLFIANKLSTKHFLFLSAFFVGLSVATKVSSSFFVILPLFVLSPLFIEGQKKKLTKKTFAYGFFYICLTIFFAGIFSPHNLINFREFLSTVRYESAVALGTIDVFYTRQFFLADKVLFPLIKIFPYALGLPASLLFFLGFLFLNTRDSKINLLRLAFIIYFFLNLFIYTQWTRFYAPIFPLMIIFVILFLGKTKNVILFSLISLLTIIPGIAYLNIYQNQDIRIEASEWIYKNLPNNSYLLSETANVVDVPFLSENIYSKTFSYNAFNFYDLDKNDFLLTELNQALTKADFIIIPSRRILFNFTCIKNPNDFAYQTKRCAILHKKYPHLINYYKNFVFNEENYRLIKVFSRYPQIKLFGRVVFELPDEVAEETFSVFDHPVIRIFQKIKKN